MANALQYYTNLAALNASAGLESIAPNEPIPNPSERRTSNFAFGGHMVSAGILTFVIAVFFFGLIGALGFLTGESVFRRVEAVI